MAPKGKTQERAIQDKDIIHQAHLFPEEEEKAVADQTAELRMPKNVRLQRQRRILMERMKVPPAVNQLNIVADKALAISVFKVLDSLKPNPEDLKKKAAKAADESAPVKAKHERYLVHGCNNVTVQIEKKNVRFVAIAADVDPVEVVLHIPALCRKMEVPYVVLRSKAQLGQLFGMKHVSCVAVLNSIPQERVKSVQQVVESIRATYLEPHKDDFHHWGGGKLSEETQAKLKLAGKN